MYVAYAFNFPDALAGAAAAGQLGGPVLLTDTGSLNTTTRSELARLRPMRIVILGSTGVVSATVANQLQAYATGS